MTATIVPIDGVKKEKVCSFCKTPESKAKKFIASTVTNHCICDKCIEKAYKAHKETN